MVDQWHDPGQVSQGTSTAQSRGASPLSVAPDAAQSPRRCPVTRHVIAHHIPSSVSLDCIGGEQGPHWRTRNRRPWIGAPRSPAMPTAGRAISGACRPCHDRCCTATHRARRQTVCRLVRRSSQSGGRVGDAGRSSDHVRASNLDRYRQVCRLPLADRTARTALMTPPWPAVRLQERPSDRVRCRRRHGRSRRRRTPRR